jgi:hypothetical protein
MYFEGWGHYSESRAEIEQVFSTAALKDRLRWLEPGHPTDLYV